MKFATKCTWHCPTHLRHVATLPWEMKNSNFLQMWKKTQTNRILIASNFCYASTNFEFSVFIIGNLFPYWLQIKFSMSLFFHYLLLRSICGIRNSSQQTLLQCLSMVTMVLSDEDKIFIKVCIWRSTQQRGWQTNFLRKVGQSMVLISCSKSCGYRHKSAYCQVKWPRTHCCP